MIDLDDYTEKYAAQYSGGPGWFETVMVAARRRQVLDFCLRHAHRRVLEVGCGLDSLMRHVSDWEEFTIVEPSLEFCDRARAEAKDRAGIAIYDAFLENVAEELSKTRAFDAIVVSSLLHEVADPARLLAAVHRLCGAETVVHFNVPNVRSFHRLLALEMGLISDLFERSATEQKFQRHTRYDRDALIKALNDAGFDLVRFATYFVKPFSHAQMEAVFDGGLLDRRAIEALDRMSKYFPDHGAEMLVEVRRR